jgi:pSer/pThr/pTyr-binding forkhead associated (FHA) protein
MPPPLYPIYMRSADSYGLPRSQGLISPNIMAMPAPASTRPYDECGYSSACSPFSHHANLLSPAVTITLNSARRTQDVTRQIVLHPDEPILIGRSSRSEFKNLSPSTDNALFDCPVVSRTHAELALSFNKWDAIDMYKIYITDTNSMHGTSVNGQKLKPNERFHLQVGDVIRLGDSVAQGQSEHPLAELRPVTSHTDNVLDSYDGVMITLDRISVAGQRNSTQAKIGQRGISCPSGSDSDSDDDSVEEVEAPSSAQTTPDQPAEKPAMKKFAKFGSSILTGIVVDDENEPESVVAAPIITARSIMVPDTYDEDSYDAPDNALNVERRLQFDDAAADGQQEMDEDDTLSEAHFSDGAHSQASNDENTSDDASSHHSFDSEPDSMSDFQDDEDEQDWAEQNDLHSVHDDLHSIHDDQHEDEEGPEIMSSKRSQSVEIGTLGDTRNDHEYQPSDVPRAAPTRSHYDPVRGMFQVAAAPITDNARTARSYDSFPPPSYSGVYANAWDSSKWDVGPTDFAVSHSSIQRMEDHSAFADVYGESFGRPTYGERIYPPGSMFDPSMYQPVDPDFRKEHGEDIPSAPASCDLSKKRKASDISTGFVNTLTLQEFQSRYNEPSQSQHPPLVQHESSSEDSVILTATEEPLTVEPPPKKLKTDQPRTKKSMLRSAALEASKYTAGAIIGGIGIVTILASPIGEALASC